MTVAYTTNVLEDGPRNHMVVVTGVSDGTTNDVGVAVDKSALVGSDGRAVTRLVVDQIEFATEIDLRLAFDHTADDLIAPLNGQGYFDWRRKGGLTDPGSAGGTGDITITPTGAAAGDSFTVTICCRKKVD